MELHGLPMVPLLLQQTRIRRWRPGIAARVLLSQPTRGIITRLYLLAGHLMGKILHLEMMTESYKFGDLHCRGRQNLCNRAYQFLWCVTGTPQTAHYERCCYVSQVCSFCTACSSCESQCKGCRHSIACAIRVDDFDTMI